MDESIIFVALQFPESDQDVVLVDIMYGPGADAQEDGKAELLLGSLQLVESTRWEVAYGRELPGFKGWTLGYNAHQVPFTLGLKQYAPSGPG